MTESTTMKERPLVEDFATIFAHVWYRGFPIQRHVDEKAQTADWTPHIGITVRATADLMGLFTRFESGHRTDAILRDSKKRAIAALEWEWKALHRPINEFDKLKELCAAKDFEGLSFAGLIGYGRQTSDRGKQDYSTRLGAVLAGWRTCWQGPPLLLIVIEFEDKGRDKIRQRRQFTNMTMYQIAEGQSNCLRKQPAYPWDVVGSRWAQETRDG